MTPTASTAQKDMSILPILPRCQKCDEGQCDHADDDTSWANIDTLVYLPSFRILVSPKNEDADSQ